MEKLSLSSLVTLYLAARFSAVTPIGVLASWSVSEVHIMSSSLGSTPSLVPNLISLTAYGQEDMLSVPPVRPTEESPTRISWTPLTIDWNPEPHSLLTISAGVGTLSTLPIHTELMYSGLIPQLAIAASLASTCRSTGLWDFREPPNAPNGVLLAATTNTPRER